MATLEEFAEILKRDETQAALHKLDGPLPSDWRAMRCNETFLIYFVQDSTRTTTWTDPRWPLPQGWIEKRDPKGVSYFVKTPEFATPDDHPTYDDPRGSLARLILMHTSLPLPSSVTVRVDDRGYVFFADAVTQTTMWTDPRAPLPVAWIQKRIKSPRPLVPAYQPTSTAIASPANEEPQNLFVSFFQNKNCKTQRTFIDPRIRIPLHSNYLLQTTQVYTHSHKFPYVVLVDSVSRIPLWHDGRDPLPFGWTAEASPSFVQKSSTGETIPQHLIFYYITRSSGLAGTSIILKTRRDPRLISDVILMIEDLKKILGNTSLLTNFRQPSSVVVPDSTNSGDLPTDDLPSILTATSIDLTRVHLAPSSSLKVVKTSAALAVTVPRAIVELNEHIDRLEKTSIEYQKYSEFAPVYEEPETPHLTPLNPEDRFDLKESNKIGMLQPMLENDEDKDIYNQSDPESDHFALDSDLDRSELMTPTSEAEAYNERKEIQYDNSPTDRLRSRASYTPKETSRGVLRASSRQDHLASSELASNSPTSRNPTGRSSVSAGSNVRRSTIGSSRVPTHGNGAGAAVPTPGPRTSVSGLPYGLSVVNSSFETAYEKEAKLDRGAFGMVWRVKRISDGQLFVMKEMDLARADLEQKRIAKQEGQLHSMLSDPYIVKHEKTFVTPTSVFVVMEYCPRGSLWDLIANRRANFATLGYWTEDQVMWWLVQLIQAVGHIHSLNIVHLDIKPANMLLANDWSIRLCDFGLSVFTTSKKIHIKDTFAGTPAYASPEQMQGQPPDQKTDVWAVGVILYILCTLVPPFGDLTAKAGPVPGKMGADETHQFHALRKRILTSAYPPLPDHFSKDLNALLARLLAKKARFRPTMQEVLEMPFIKEHLQRQSQASGASAAEHAE